MNEGPDSVEKRAKCTVETSFKALVQFIERDILKFNELPPRDRVSGLFVLEMDGDTAANVFHAHRVKVNGGTELHPVDEKGGTRLRIEIRGDSIHLQKANQSTILVTRKWNPETLDCDHILILEGEERILGLWRLSALMLEPFMFGDS